MIVAAADVESIAAAAQIDSTPDIRQFPHFKDGVASKASGINERSDGAVVHSRLRDAHHRLVRGSVGCHQFEGGGARAARDCSLVVNGDIHNPCGIGGGHLNGGIIRSIADVNRAACFIGDPHKGFGNGAGLDDMDASLSRATSRCAG